MKYRVEDNQTGAPLSRWFDDWDVAVGTCANLNMTTHRGGGAGIYDENGVRRHEPVG